MAGVLTFAQYLGGPDDINIEQIFPSTQRTLSYNFGRNIQNWTFDVDQQTIVVDSVAFDRNTGSPNFSTSKVIGYFPYGQVAAGNIVVTSLSQGQVKITIPTQMYSGPILPDARKNVPITIVGVTWTDASSPQQKNTHRWAFIQSWEPGVTPGDPALDNNFTAI